MLNTQDLLTVLVCAISVAYGLLMFTDFVYGLLHMFTRSSRERKLADENIQVIATSDEFTPSIQLEAIPDPWIASDLPLESPVKASIPETRDLPSQVLCLPPSPYGRELELDLTSLKLYKLRGEAVVRVDDLTGITLPSNIKIYALKKHRVIKLSDLEQLIN